MTWYLNRALTNFRAAVNAKYPDRDKASDGWIGDPAHQATVSDHNPDRDGSVDAWDMDVDLRSGNDPAAIEALKQVFQAHESAWYWIHNRQIASRTDGWVRRPYFGANPHDKHVHWNTREMFENSTAPWNLTEGDDVSAQDVWNLPISSDYYGVNWTAGDWLKHTLGAEQAAGAALSEVRALRATVAGLAAGVDKLASAVGVISGVDPTSLRVAVADGVREGLAAVDLGDLVAGDVAGEVVDELAERLPRPRST